MKTKRYANNYRFPPAFIQRWVRICTWTLIVGIMVAVAAGAAGIAMADAADRNGDDALSFGSFLVLMVAVVGAAAVVFALGAAAFVGGESLARGAGWFGIAFVAGLVATAVGAATFAIVFWIGIGLSALGVIGLFVAGIRNRVPMWFGNR